MSNRKLVALDAGHGLKTAGKQTPDGIKEWTLNDKVRDKIVAMLKEYNVDFIFPDNDEGVADESLSSRRGMYVKAKVDAAVSLHHNGFTGKWNSATGVEVYTDRSHTAKDRELAECIYAKLPKYTGLKGRGIKKANFAVINQNSVPAVLVEGGFMDGEKDYHVITSDAGQTGYAKAVAEGLIEFLKLEKAEEDKKVMTGKIDQTPSNFLVKVDIPNLNIRKGPGTNYATHGHFTGIGTFTIVDVKPGKGSSAGWGLLKAYEKNRNGWVSLYYAKRV